MMIMIIIGGKNSSVNTETRRSGDRIPVGPRFSAPVQYGPGFHTASYRISTGSFQEVKRLGHGLDNQVPSCIEVKERVYLYLY